MTLTLYGIPNCDTVKKARRWLDEQGVAHHFHDYRKDGLDAAQLQGWIDALGWEKLLNRSGTGLFVVYNDRRDTTRFTPYETVGRSFIVKYTRLVDF